MEQAERKNPPFGEAKLNELLDFACDQLYPTTGFTLELDGIDPTVLTRKELEAYSKVSLDQATAATIKLAYDTTKDALLLESLRHPLDGQPSAQLVIHRTTRDIDGLEYIIFIEAGGQEYPGKPDKNVPLTNERVNNFLAGYGVADIPHPNHEMYRLWRANLLSNCQKGWKVSEEVELLVDYTDRKSETILITTNENYAEEGEIIKTKRLARVYEMYEDITSSQKIESAIHQIDNSYGRSLNMQLQVTELDHSPFVLGDTPTVTRRQVENIALDHDSFSTFRGLVEDATLYLHAQKKKLD